jgi:gelsolin
MQLQTVELDDCLGQVPVQHREVQDHESQLFLSYFREKGGIRILAGGIDSGFNHVKPTEYKPRLLHVKGRKSVRVTEVPMSYKSLNSGDVFVLDAGMKLFQWQGSKCGGQERVKAATLVQAIDDERGGKPVKIHVSETDKPTEEGAAEFWKMLGGIGPIAPADDLDDSWEDAKPCKLFRIRFGVCSRAVCFARHCTKIHVSDAKGAIKMELAGQGIIPMSKLDTNDAFLLDVGCELFVWIGHKASAQEKQQGMALAQKYIVDNKLPNWLPISKVHQGGENEVFKTYLSGEKRKIGTPVQARHK